MAADFKLGCTYNFLQPGEKWTPLQRFERVRDSGVFDYINWLPPDRILEDCIAASRATGIPMTTGNCSLMLGRDDASIEQVVRNAARVEMRLLNVMLNAQTAAGGEITDREVIDTYRRMSELGSSLGVEVSFELHVDCWTEKYKRITPVIEQARREDLDFKLTLDYSHAVFKIDNPAEQEVSGVRHDVEAGRVVLDPFEEGNLCQSWLDLGAIRFAQFRPVAPNNPRNIWARTEDGRVPRGIMYPFVKPGPGEWHFRWEPWRLETCKEAFRTVLRHHLTRPTSRLEFVITEMIPSEDYGLNAKFSLFDQNAACARWIRSTWSQMKAMHAAGIPLQA